MIRRFAYGLSLLALAAWPDDGALARSFDWAVFSGAGEALSECLKKHLDADQLEALGGGERPRDKRLRRAAKKAYQDCAAGAPAASAAAADVGPLIDAHAHFGGGNDRSLESIAQAALAAMEESGFEAAVVMLPPYPPGHREALTATEFAGPVRRNPGRLAFLGGGGTLNGMIHTAVRKGAVSAGLRDRFEKTAEDLLAMGARGFGEVAAEHFSLSGPQHPYLSAPPDHPLFLLLADIAARHGVPIDFHMEAIPEDMAAPDGLGPPNPERLKANIGAFERLLAHNRKANIVWAHVGWDNTGQRTVGLSRRLLGAHPNLFMSTKLDRKDESVNRMTDKRGRLTGEWRRLIEDFPDRFVLGSDQKHGVRGKGDPGRKFKGLAKLVSQLSPEAAAMVGRDNAKRLFKLGE